MINGVSQYGSSMNGVDFSAMRARREEMFTKMDTNSDGYVDKAELTSFLQQLSGTGQTPPNAEDMLSRLDTDSDGKISKAEFKKHRHEDMFAKMDTNGDGNIDKAELTSFLQQLSGTGQTPPNAEDMLSRLDTDSDGKISKAEFEKHRHEDMFAKMDTNGDGNIDKAELTSFGQRMSGMGPAAAPPDPEKMFSRLDTNGDGKISKAEFGSADPRTEKQAASTALSQSGLENGVTAASLTTLLNSLVGKDKETDSLFSSAIQQYAMSVPVNTQSILDLLG